ncbi:MAG: efflux RND transporter periplasmic adaptor subunit [Deltaproteobacteria bacterium]|nr:efflux RND transporter periplasmic adaptor subunit [Deltaproteobacteria bacterium]
MRRKLFFKNITLRALAASVAVLFFSVGCGKEAGTPVNNGTKAAGVAALGVKTALAEERNIVRSVESVGTLLAWEEVTVSSDAAGTVEKINADLGDKVKAGGVLAVLDQREARLNLEDAEAAHQTGIKTLEKEKARLEDSKTTFKRNSELKKQGMVSESQFDAARTQYDVALAQMKEAGARARQSAARLNFSRKRLADTIIKAPISGEVSKRFVSAGEAVRERMGLFTIVSTGRLKFSGAVPEVFVPDLEIGAEVAVSIEAFKDRVFKGRLTRLSPVVSPETRTLEIEAVIPNADGALKPGFFAKGAVSAKKSSAAVFVPEAAVYSFAGVTKVFVVSGGKASERRVSTASSSGDMVEVIGDIKAGDNVALNKLGALFDGAPVVVEAPVKVK